jgi:hypothetical protein
MFVEAASRARIMSTAVARASATDPIDDCSGGAAGATVAGA